LAAVNEPELSLILVVVDPTPPLYIATDAFAITSEESHVYATPVSTPLPNTPDNQASPGFHPGPIKAADMPEIDPSARLIDTTEEAWGVISARLLTAETNVVVHSALASGYLAKRAGAGDEDGITAIGIRIIHQPADVNPDSLLRDLLTMYRSLNAIARARGVEDGALPWHIAMARKAYGGLSNM
jgi:hypothetical protein